MKNSLIKSVMLSSALAVASLPVFAQQVTENKHNTPYEQRQACKNRDGKHVKGENRKFGAKKHHARARAKGNFALDATELTNRLNLTPGQQAELAVLQDAMQPKHKKMKRGERADGKPVGKRIGERADGNPTNKRVGDRFADGNKKQFDPIAFGQRSIAMQERQLEQRKQTHQLFANFYTSLSGEQKEQFQQMRQEQKEKFVAQRQERQEKRDKMRKQRKQRPACNQS